MHMHRRTLSGSILKSRHVSPTRQSATCPETGGVCPAGHCLSCARSRVTQPSRHEGGDLCVLSRPPGAGQAQTCPTSPRGVSTRCRIMWGRTSGSALSSTCSSTSSDFPYVSVAVVLRRLVCPAPSGRSPHMIRHAAACHLPRADMDINTIRTWLGHASLEKTGIHAEINLDMKAGPRLPVTRRSLARAIDEGGPRAHGCPESHAGAHGSCCGHSTIIPAQCGADEPPQHNGDRHTKEISICGRAAGRAGSRRPGRHSKIDSRFGASDMFRPATGHGVRR